jgi:hypothetical protein
VILKDKEAKEEAHKALYKRREQWFRDMERNNVYVTENDYPFRDDFEASYQARAEIRKAVDEFKDKDWN